MAHDHWLCVSWTDCTNYTIESQVMTFALSRYIVVVQWSFSYVERVFSLFIVCRNYML